MLIEQGLIDVAKVFAFGVELPSTLGEIVLFLLNFDLEVLALLFERGALFLEFGSELLLL